MVKALRINHQACTGCRLCQVVCSVKKEGVSDPGRARIQILMKEMEGVYLPVVCRQCEDPLCAEACPVEAISIDESTGLVVMDQDLCTGCLECISACPYGGIFWHEDLDKILRCDLCGGDPECVKFCATKAIEWVEADQAGRREELAEAEVLYASLKNTA